MDRHPIPVADLVVRAHHLWATQSMLLTAGDFAGGRFNTMAVGWGSLGTMWGTELALEMLGQAGFPLVRVERLAHDFQNSYYLARKA